MNAAVDNAGELSQFHGGLKLAGHKRLSTLTPIARMPAQARYIIPVLQHIGVAGEVLVSVGERVRKGQMLARPRHLVSAAIHAPVSGVVNAIGNYPVPHPSGIEDLCIVLNNDGKDECIEQRAVGANCFNLSPHELRNIIRDAGIVGLGGAAFPSAVKQTEIDIQTLIINGVECEPYITCDDMLMREHAREIIAGAEVIGHIIKAREIIIAIEDNKPEAIAAMQAAVAEDNTGYFRVQAVPTIYPSGGEKQLIKVVLDKEVPSNGLPNDISVLCQNVGTAYAIYRAIYHGEPLISRLLTVTGHGVQCPQNVWVDIGTPMQACIEFCGGYTNAADGMIMGGPMMGFTLRNDELPVIKASNCLLVTTREDALLPASHTHLPCIRCGHCVDVCPANLLPQQLYWFASAGQHEHAVKHHLFDCIECGCCAYVCPSRIPLVQYYRHAKSDIWAQERERKQADIARERHAARLARLEAQKLAREDKLRQKREALNARTPAKSADLTHGADARQAAIAAALARVEAKKQQQGVTAKNMHNLTPEQQQLIAAVEKRRAEASQTSHPQDN
jgi:electron transport complex protein RnfC